MKKQNIRTASLKRTTKETMIKINLNLDGTGESNIKTNFNFFNHLLTSFAYHGRFNLSVEATGDLQHHIIEDVGITLGQTFKKALGDRKNITRFGKSILPMDESLVITGVDLVKSPYSKIQLNLEAPKIEDTVTENIIHFLSSFAINLESNIHIFNIYGENDHHKAEAAFKSLALALREACNIDINRNDVPSTKGVI